MNRLLTLSLLVLVGCGSPTAPFVPTGSQQYEAPEVYAAWWAEVEADLGADGDMAGVRWYEVAGGMFYHPSHGKVIGGMWSQDRSIYIAEGLTRNRGLVKHEMLHDLLGGDMEHRHPLFRTYAGQ